MENSAGKKRVEGKLGERHIVLVAPEIHWNTGNIGRTCLGTGSTLHLVKPLGFSLDSKHIRRAGLDYWPRVRLRIWNSFEEFELTFRPRREELFLFSKSGRQTFWSMTPETRMFLVFGSETRGLPEAIVRRYRKRIYCIPINGNIRSLNLSTAAGIALYESLRTCPPRQHD